MSDIYRDPSEGAAAKRQDLLRRRRDELATMPHAIRRVVVARNARAAAGMAMVLGGSAMIAVALRPTFAERLDAMLPGVQPASISTLLFGAWLVSVLAYMVSRARSEHRFAVAMSHYVLPGKNLDHDLQRLDHEHPDEMARGMAHRREIASVAWLVLGTALVVPATLMYIGGGLHAHGWPVMREFETALAEHAGALAGFGLIGALGALVVTTRAARMPHAALVELGVATAIVVASLVTSLPIALAVVPVVMAMLVRRLRRERLAITAIDPAAGSEIFNFKDAMRGAWRGVCAVGRVAGKPATLRAAVALVLLVGGWQYLGSKKKAAPERLPAPSSPSLSKLDPPRPMSPEAPTGGPGEGSIGGYETSIDSTGTLMVRGVIDGAHPIALPDLVGVAAVPAHWDATVELALADITEGGNAIEATPFTNPTGFVTVGTAPHVFEARACTGDDEPLGLHIKTSSPTPVHFTLAVKTTLFPINCR